MWRIESRAGVRADGRRWCTRRAVADLGGVRVIVPLTRPSDARSSCGGVR